MADLVTSRIPRETLVGLLADSRDQRERITAPIPAQHLEELLEDPAPAPAVVTLEASTPSVASHHIILWSFTLTILIGALIFLLV